MKNGKFEIRNDWNPDVPVETLLKNEMKENRKLHQIVGELESEIQYLNNVIDRRNQAISDFKKWQKDIARMKIEDWVRKAKKMADSQEELERFNLVKNAVKNLALFESMLRKLERAYAMFQENMGRLQREGGQE